jgi:hypothetical protein
MKNKITHRQRTCCVGHLNVLVYEALLQEEDHLLLLLLLLVSEILCGSGGRFLLTWKLLFT